MRRLTALVLLVLVSIESSGCYAWHQDSKTVPITGQGLPNGVYRVTLVSGSVYEVTNIRFRSDSVLGAADSWKVVRGTTEYTTHPIGFAVGEVARVERRAPSTVAVISGVALMIGAIVAMTLGAKSAIDGAGAAAFP